ncbi:sulfate/molybdate ABC transporter ATP-binding protein [Mucilaginibacter sp.]
MIKLNIRKKLNLPNGEADLHIDTELQTGSLTALYGPSGAGKTSVLKMVAGLMQPDEGIIEVNGVTWLNTYKNITLPPQKRDTGFMFQDYALFPNMTVQQNLEFAMAKEAGKGELQHLLSIMQLESLAHRKPAMLSGGQQQRVALARAILKRPQVLLLDEPLSAVGNELRVSLRNQLADLHQQYGFTTLLVSHEVSEIYHLAKRVLHMKQGRVVADEVPGRLFNSNSGDLTLIGEVVAITKAGAEVLVNNQVIVLPVPTTGDTALLPGQKVTLRCNAAGMSLQKLS